MVSEPGNYSIAASVAWDSNMTATGAEVMLAINGLDTPYRHQTLLSPTIRKVQNQDVWATLRLHAGDRVSVKVSHNAGALTFFTNADVAAQSFTHLSMYYLGP